MKSLQTSLFFAAVLGVLALCGPALADPDVPAGYYVEAYVTGLQNVQSIAFSPGGDFGYEGQLFVGDSRPNGVIYRVPSKDTKIHFATGANNQLLSMAFAPMGSAFGPNLYVTHGYDIYAYSSAGTGNHFANVNAFPWDLAFAPDERFRNHLFHADGWEPASDGEAIREWTPTGTQSTLIANLPEETCGLAFGPGGDFGNDLYVAFANSRGSTPAIRRVTPDGVMTDLVLSPEFGQTSQLGFDTTGNFGGNLFVSDWENDVIFEIDPDGTVSTFGTGFSFSSSPEHAQAQGDIVFGPDGGLYVTDGGAGIVWRIAPILGELDHIEITGPGGGSGEF